MILSIVLQTKLPGLLLAEVGLELFGQQTLRFQIYMAGLDAFTAVIVQVGFLLLRGCQLCIRQNETPANHRAEFVRQRLP